MSNATRIRDIEGEKARRRAARELIGRYHEEQLRGLLDHVREGFERLDRGEIDVFELDELIHRYKRSAQKLWSYCGSSGGARESAALTVEVVARARRGGDGLVGSRRATPPPGLRRPRFRRVRRHHRARADGQPLLRWCWLGPSFIRRSCWRTGSGPEPMRHFSGSIRFDDWTDS